MTHTQHNKAQTPKIDSDFVKLALHCLPTSAPKAELPYDALPFRQQPKRINQMRECVTALLSDRELREFVRDRQERAGGGPLEVRRLRYDSDCGSYETLNIVLKGRSLMLQIELAGNLQELTLRSCKGTQAQAALVAFARKLSRDELIDSIHGFVELNSGLKRC